MYPVLGGAMKPTVDGRWAHLACAIWIPGIIMLVCCFLTSYYHYFCLINISAIPQKLACPMLRKWNPLMG